ncbi:MAG TPA: ABC transporter substrate-binding protein [Rhodospirillaceae bacterium]|nr:ABC transporter substrate-binding protein [Rhodospirillaceae bacterium]
MPRSYESKSPQPKRSSSTTKRQEALVLYSKILTIREAELRLGTLFADGEVPGFIHLSVGQEAVPVGVMSSLEAHDTVASNHRGHGHAIAKGVDLNRLFQEIMAKDEGYCRGRGGSMHVADTAVGMLGANGIVGAGLPIALGSALAHQIKKRNSIAVVFFGDGALAEGVLHECLNLASMWNLPLLFVCENNGWSEFSPTSSEFIGKLSDLAQVFKISSKTVDGNDVFSVLAASQRAVRDIRAGKGPKVIECLTHRVRGHFEGDQQKYRDAQDIKRAAQSDPVIRMEKHLIDIGIPKAEIAAIKSKVIEQVERAVAAGRKGTTPQFGPSLADVYTPHVSH